MVYFVVAVLASLLAALSGDPDLGALLMSSGAAAAPEETMKKVKNKLEEVVDPEDGLVAKVQENTKYVSDLKGKVNRILQDVSDKVDEIKEAEEKKRNRLKSELHERLDDLEMAAGGGRRSGQSIKQRVTSAIKTSPISDMSSSVGPGAGAEAEMSLGIKDIIDAPGAGAEGVTPDIRQDDIVGDVRRSPQVVDLLPSEPISTGTAEYMREVPTGNDVGSQGEQGNALPESDYQFELRSESTEAVGHTVPVALQLLDDIGRLEAFIRRVMRTDLLNKVDKKVLTDDGTAGQLDGLVPNSRAYNSDLEAEIVDTTGNAVVTDLDRLMVAITQLTRQDFTPTGMILPALNWSSIQLIKDADGDYLFIQPQGETALRLFGLPVAATNALTEGSAHVGAYEQAAQIADREEVGVQASTEHKDNFERLVATLRAYLRIAVLVRRPDGLVSLDDELDAQQPTAA